MVGINLDEAIQSRRVIPENTFQPLGPLRLLFSTVESNPVLLEFRLDLLLAMSELAIVDDRCKHEPNKRGCDEQRPKTELKPAAFERNGHPVIVMRRKAGSPRNRGLYC